MDDSTNTNTTPYQDPNSPQQPQPQPQSDQAVPAQPQPSAYQAAPQPNTAASQQQRPPLRIDDALLTELGLGSLPEDERKALQKHIYETLEMNVGMRLADQMSNEQLDEFEQYFNARDDAGAFKWLETNFPNYKDIVADEFEKLKVEVAQNAPQILAASQQNPAQATPPPAPDAPHPGADGQPPTQMPPNYQQ
jgi:hypothetical protein